jgi:gamma-glutamylcyclotransferase (GGCT)/AIG2-like uncharacterized protein YtfP
MVQSSDLFVYGTLRFGDVRWKFLEPFVVDEGFPDTAAGRLFDTGAGYPAALFDTVVGVSPQPLADRSATIVGHRYRLIPGRIDTALEVLDEVESTVTGMYQRVQIVTGTGSKAWAYQYGLAVDDPSLALREIISGDWFEFFGRHVDR